nr:hypothetical protein CFP56_50900 [Quercus suber]
MPIKPITGVSRLQRFLRPGHWVADTNLDAPTGPCARPLRRFRSRHRLRLFLVVRLPRSGHPPPRSLLRKVGGPEGRGAWTTVNESGHANMIGRKEDGWGSVIEELGGKQLKRCTYPGQWSARMFLC